MRCCVSRGAVIARRMTNASTMVTLRPSAMGDLWLLRETLGNPAMMEHLGGIESAEQIERRHARFLSGRDMFTVWESGSVVGSVGFWEKTWRDEDVYEAGWMILPKYAGRGLATQAALAVISLACSVGKHRYLHAFPNVRTPRPTRCAVMRALRIWASTRSSIRRATGCAATIGASTYSQIRNASRAVLRERRGVASLNRENYRRGMAIRMKATTIEIDAGRLSMVSLRTQHVDSESIQ